MKEFDYEAAKKGAKVQTRDGRPVRIICWDRKNTNYPIVALIDNGEFEGYDFYTQDGKLNISKTAPLDLVMAITKKEGWINIYPNNSSTSYIYETKEDAERHCTVNRVACVHVEWEE